MTEVENLQNSLKMIIEIRSRASELWKSVAEGMTSKHGDEDKEKKFLSELKLMLDTIGSKIKYDCYVLYISDMYSSSNNYRMKNL